MMARSMRVVHPSSGACLSKVADVTRFRLNTIVGERADIIAHFDIRIGDFTVYGGTLRAPHDGADAFVSMPGRRTSGISIAQPSDTRDAIHHAVYARYHAETGRWP